MVCPYCGEALELGVDFSVATQEYIEDCAVCCQPMLVTIRFGADGEAEVCARQENG